MIPAFFCFKRHALARSFDFGRPVLQDKQVVQVFFLTPMKLALGLVFLQREQRDASEGSFLTVSDEVLI